MIIGSGIQIGSGIRIISEPEILGSTASTVNAAAAGASSIGATNGSPFSPAVNNYVIPAPGTVPPYNYYSAAGNAGFNFGTGNFTIEWFQYQTDSNAFPRPIWYSNGSNAVSWGISIESGFYFWDASPVLLATSSSLGTYKNVWVHFAVVRSGGSLRLYKNGTLIGGPVSNTTSITNTTHTLFVGAKPYGGLASEQFGGSITSFRVCNIGVYTGNFTVPTSRLAQTQGANPYGGSNTRAITAGQCVMLLNP